MTCHSAPMSPGLFLHSPLLGHSASLQAAAGRRHSGPLNPQQMALLWKNKNPSRPMNSSGDLVLATAGSNKDTPSRGPTPICKASSQPVPPNTARAPKQSAHRGRDLLPLLSRTRDQAPSLTSAAPSGLQQHHAPLETRPPWESGWGMGLSAPCPVPSGMDSGMAVGGTARDAIRSDELVGRLISLQDTWERKLRQERLCHR